jgi:ribose transport system ATP-binding protein
MSTIPATLSLGEPPNGSLGLHMRGISKSFFATKALTRVDLDVAPGEVVAMLGENGAGKSTLSSVIAGIIQPDEGEMRWRGQSYVPKSPGDALQAGIALIHQETKLLPDLTIAENVFLGHLLTKGGNIDRTEMNRRAGEQLDRLGLRIPPTRVVKGLPIAAQQQIEIAKALTLHAKLLILDEPTAALGGEETERLFAQVAALQKEDVSFIYVSHRLEEIAKVSNRIVVLRDGQMVAANDRPDIPVRRLVEQMVGRSIDQVYPDLPTPQDREVIQVSNLTSAVGKFTDISFTVHAGEIFGIAGIVGAGRTEVVRAISGADPISSGSVTLDGKPLNLSSPERVIKSGVVLVPEDRKGQGVILDMSLSDNITLANLDRLRKSTRSGWITPAATNKLAKQVLGSMTVKGRVEQRAGTLSGGNQQKVVIGKWLAAGCRLFLFDEPTRGIDVGAKSEIFALIEGLVEHGAAVLLISSELTEIVHVCDRAYVMRAGRIGGELARAELSEENILRLAMHEA